MKRMMLFAICLLLGQSLAAETRDNLDTNPDSSQNIAAGGCIASDFDHRKRGPMMDPEDYDRIEKMKSRYSLDPIALLAENEYKVGLCIAVIYLYSLFRQ